MWQREARGERTQAPTDAASGRATMMACVSERLDEVDSSQSVSTDLLSGRYPWRSTSYIPVAKGKV